MSEPTPDLDHLDLRPLPGSERPSAEGAEPAPTPLDPASRIEVTVVVRRKTALPEPIGVGGPLSAAEFASTYGADPDDLETVTSTFSSLGLDVVSVEQASRLVRVAGAAADVARVFGADLQLVTSTTAGVPVTHRHRTGGLSVPAALDGIVVAVLGLDDRPQARAQLRIAAPGAVSTSYTPLQVGAVYRFPDGLDGSGQTVAIVELGGGFDETDLNTYFSGLGLTAPAVRAVGVDGGGNKPGQDSGADAEVMLDVEVAGALAPAAQFVVYFAPNTDAGFVDAVSQATHAQPTPAAISISWGASEDVWTQQARSALDQALADAAALGVTVTIAAGDDGSADRETDGKAHVDFPASSPHALGCGGTSLQADPTTGQVSTETVWNDGPGQGATGGGVSDAFPLPDWQDSVGVPAGASGGAGGSGGSSGGRGVPDVAGVADPQTGYQVRVGGQDAVIGGTSAVAPLWAALVARLAQSTGRLLGPLQPALYGGVTAGDVAPGFRDITEGSNGAYAAASGWDACTGLGVPDGQQLLDRLAAGPSGQPLG